MEAWDVALFHFINSTLSNAFFDWLMPTVTDLHKNFYFQWLVLPILLAFWLYKKRGRALPVLVGCVICVGIVDGVTYRILKPTFKRERPPVAEKEIQLRTDRFSGYSFPSNHAANNLTAAAFLSSCYPALTPLFYGIAVTIAFSRVYVGVHYPADVLIGGLLGAIFGLLFFRLWGIILLRLNKRWPRLVWLQPEDSAGVKNGQN